MKPVTRAEIVDYQTYADGRDELRRLVMAEKAKRRVHVGDVLTFLFENRLMVRYQVQEMMLAERIARESDIKHELETYNELLGGDGELGCTLLIEIADAEERKHKLAGWLALPRHIYAVRDDGERVYASYDARQVGQDRLSSVQFLKLAVGDEPPRAIGCDLPGLVIETALSDTQRAALARDLGE